MTFVTHNLHRVNGHHNIKDNNCENDNNDKNKLRNREMIFLTVISITKVQAVIRVQVLRIKKR